MTVESKSDVVRAAIFWADKASENPRDPIFVENYTAISQAYSAAARAMS